MTSLQRSKKTAKVSYRQYQPNPALFTKLLLRHLQAGISSLGRLFFSPVSSLLTISAISIALSLPAIFLLVVYNGEKFTQHWQVGNHVSLFLNIHLSERQVQNVYKKVNASKEVAQARLITPKEGLAELEGQLGFNNLAQQLPTNPLPAVLVVTPVQSIDHPNELDAFSKNFQDIEGVDSVQLDMGWVVRWHHFLHLAKRFGLGLLFLMASSVVLIIGNIIRLSFQSHLDEIRIMKLFGGTSRFIRRPFLYTGFYFGFLGALGAVVLIVILVSIIEGPFHNLLSLYDIHLYLHGLNLTSVTYLLLIGGLVGWLGAWLSIQRHLNQVRIGV